MVKTIITPDKDNVNIHIPEKYIGKKIEVLLYAVEEYDDEKPTNRTGTMSAFKGILSPTEADEFRNMLRIQETNGKGIFNRYQCHN